MPIYEYKCLGCASHFEKMQKLSDAPPAVCEKCGGKLEKQWSLSGFQFKGAGWYVTDYSNKGKADDVKTETKSGDAASKTETTTKDSGKTASGSEKSEKTSAVESTAKTETASKTTKSDTLTSKKE